MPLIGLVTWLCGCNALLGIKVLPTETDAGSITGAAGVAGQGGAAGHAAADGGGTGAGTSAGGGRGGSAEVAIGGSGGGGNSGNAGGNAGRGGMGGAAGAAGAGGGANAGPVSGKVIDYRKQAVSGALVRIGTQTTMSDAQGRFGFADVPASYDLALTIHTTIVNNPATCAWRVEGLTRRDPTVQVDPAQQEHDTTLHTTVSNVTFPLDPQQKVGGSWSSADGSSFSFGLNSAQTELPATWYGPTQSVGHAHALLFSVGSDLVYPTAYLAHDTHAVVLNQAMDEQVTFDLTPAALPMGTITGTVTGAATDERAILAYLRFVDGAVIDILTDSKAGPMFSFIAPQLANASMTVVAQNKSGLGFATALVDNVAPGQPALTLEVPAIPSLNAPAPNATNVDANTQFQWSPSSGKTMLFCAHTSPLVDIMCVLTAKTTTTLPIAPTTEYTPPPNTLFVWDVQMHGEIANVDDASGSDGFMGAVTDDLVFEGHLGPVRGDGRFARSVGRTFTTRP
jgi:hypothetical protein